MKVTVVLTVYEAADYLQQAIDSVLGQTFRDWELVIADDGSKDPRIKEILEAIVDQRVTAFSLETTEAERRMSVRYASLINWAVEMCDSPYVTFLCGDDFYYPDRLERMVKKLDAGHSVTYGPQALLNEDGSNYGYRPAPGVLTIAYHQVDLNSVMIRRDIFQKVGGFPTEPTDQMWREADAHLWNRLTDAGYFFVPVDGPEPTDAKRYRDDSVDMKVRQGEVPW